MSKFRAFTLACKSFEEIDPDLQGQTRFQLALFSRSEEHSRLTPELAFIVKELVVKAYYERISDFCEKRFIKDWSVEEASESIESHTVKLSI